MGNILCNYFPVNCLIFETGTLTGKAASAGSAEREVLASQNLDLLAAGGEKQFLVAI